MDTPTAADFALCDLAIEELTPERFADLHTSRATGRFGVALTLA